MEACDNPFSMKSSVDDQNVKTMLFGMLASVLDDSQAAAASRI
jgi:hypothetical protein